MFGILYFISRICCSKRYVFSVVVVQVLFIFFIRMLTLLGAQISLFSNMAKGLREPASALFTATLLLVALCLIAIRVAPSAEGNAERGALP